MGPWEFLIAVCSGYLGLVVGWHIIDRQLSDRRRDRRIKEWTRMIREKRKNGDEWASKTWREKKKK